jgi:hypothetical protein
MQPRKQSLLTNGPETGAVRGLANHTPGIPEKPAQRRESLLPIVALDYLKASATWLKIPDESWS